MTDPQTNGGADGARRALKAPAIAILVTAVVGLLCAGASLGMSTFIRETALKDDSLDETGRRAIDLMYGVGAWVIHGWGAAASVVAILGALAMLNAKSRGFAIAACVVVMTIPSCCCCIAGIGVGVWGLIVLMRPEVKAAF